MTAPSLSGGPGPWPGPDHALACQYVLGVQSHVQVCSRCGHLSRAALTRSLAQPEAVVPSLRPAAGFQARRAARRALKLESVTRRHGDGRSRPCSGASRSPNPAAADSDTKRLSVTGQRTPRSNSTLNVLRLQDLSPGGLGQPPSRLRTGLGGPGNRAPGPGDHAHHGDESPAPGPGPGPGPGGCRRVASSMTSLWVLLSVTLAMRARSSSSASSRATSRTCVWRRVRPRA